MLLKKMCLVKNCILLIALFLLGVNTALADFDMKTGYYVGTEAGGLEISGFGFEPDLVIIRQSNASSDGALFKTSAMPAANTGYFADVADDTSSLFSLEADGFTLSANAIVNAENTIFYYAAFGGSDCSSSGSFCVGQFTGNGSSPRAINTGFGPDFVTVKRATSGGAGNLRTSSMPNSNGAFYSNDTWNTAGALFTTLNADGFTVGATNNTNTIVYNYFVFENTSGLFLEDSYTGNNTGQSISGLGFEPTMVLIKNAAGSGTANRRAVFKVMESFGDFSSFLGIGTTGNTNFITSLDADGFTVGSNNTVSQSGATIYYAAFGGFVSPALSGDFEMETGFYTGNGGSQSISDLDFEPDFVMIKSTTAQEAVYRTSLMNQTHFTASNTGSVTNGISSLNADGFTVSDHASVNTNGLEYHWQAIGGAFNPHTNAGSENFTLGAYYGNGTAGRSMQIFPSAQDFVFIRRAANPGVWRNSTVVGDVTYFLSATNVNTNRIQNLSGDTVELGANTSVNASFPYWWVSFKNSDNFQVGSYTGNATDNRDITGIGFQPDWTWIKGQNASGGIHRPSSILTNSSLRFNNTAAVANLIKVLFYDTFRIGTPNDVNQNGITYIWAVWNAKKFSQENYRFFENADSTLVGSPLETENTPYVTGGLGEEFRLRMIIDVTRANLLVNGVDFKLQYAEKGLGSCAVPDIAYADVTGSSDIAYFNNPSVDSDDPLIGSANDPSSTNAIIDQSYIENNNFTNNQATIQKNQSGLFDFSLFDNAENAGAVYCFRVVNSDGTVFAEYNQYPEVEIFEDTEQSVSFAISNNNIGFGELTTANARYATVDGLGAASDIADAHTLEASTSATDGYIIVVNGTSPTCSSCGPYSLASIGSVATASSPNSEQFGLRLIVNSGSGTVSAPYNTVNWAFDQLAFPDMVAGGDGDDVTTEFGVRYIANISPVTPGGSYEGVLEFLMTAIF